MKIRVVALMVAASAFIACDEDFSTVGGQVIENPTDVEVQEYEVTAYNKKLNSVQTNNMPMYALGVYADPFYGQSVASILTQVSLSSSNPSFGEGALLDSVVLSLPYFSTEEENDQDGELQYRLDSIYGNEPIHLSIQESGFFLNDLDPEADFQDRQKYYSDQQGTFEQHLVGEVLYENEQFEPVATAIVDYDVDQAGETDTITSGPALRVKLPVDYFQEKIIDREGSSVLSNNNNFRNYLRGFLIKAQPIGNSGSLMNFNMGEGSIKLYYTHQVEGEDDQRQRGSYELNFGANIVNTFEGEFPAEVLQAINEADKVNGDENLFLKGGEGSMAVIELFEDETQLEELRENQWLINEAKLIFHVKQELMAGVEEPERLYIYDLDNNRVLADYSFAENFIGDLNPEAPENSMTTFSVPLERDEEGVGVQYALNLTQHIAQLINGDRENVRLGVVVTQNINITSGSTVRGDEEVTQVPRMSILAPQGTVVYGNATTDESRKLKLKVFYTRTRE